MLDYYAIRADEFAANSRFTFNFLETHDDLCRAFARQLVDLIRANTARGALTKVILPVGPLDYAPFAELCNRERVSCESLVIFPMDEYANEDGSAVSVEHPLSFRAFYQHNLLDRLDRELRLPPDQLILPDPANLDHVREQFARFSPVEVCYGGFGINGHFAFNSPVDGDTDLETFRSSTVRIVRPREGDVAQMAMGGTAGNLEIIPPKAATLGMKELLSAQRLHLTFMRSWHAGVLRRALFGPITPAFPGSLVQLHPDVTVSVTAIAAKLPPFSLLQNPGA